MKIVLKWINVSFSIKISNIFVWLAGDVRGTEHPRAPSRLLERSHLPVDFGRRLDSSPVCAVRLPLHHLHALFCQGKGTNQQLSVIIFDTRYIILKICNVLHFMYFMLYYFINNPCRELIIVHKFISRCSPLSNSFHAWKSGLTFHSSDSTLPSPSLPSLVRRK